MWMTWERGSGSDDEGLGLARPGMVSVSVGICEGFKDGCGRGCEMVEEAGEAGLSFSRG